MTIDRAAFYAAVRSSLFGGRLSDAQVQGMDAILDAAPSEMPREHLAYCLATAFHETARTMQPIKEYGGPAYFKRMYDPQGDRPAVAKSLGNTKPGDGVKFCGRGYVQMTGRSNYTRAGKKLGVDLVNQPELALQPSIAARIMFEGMKDGWFTGKQLSTYFAEAKADAVNARRIINGTDRAKVIAGYYGEFLKALKVSGHKPVPPAPPKRPDTPPAPAPKPQPVTNPIPVVSWWRALWARFFS